MRKTMLFAIVAMCAACRNTEPSSKTREGSGSAVAAGSAESGSAAGSAVGSGSAVPDSPPVPETPEARLKRAEAALGRVASIKPKVAQIRNLPFVRDVPTKYQPTPEFQAFVRRELAKELPPEKSQKRSAAFAHIGLLDKPVDIATVTEQAAITQAGAYYDPGAKAFFLVMVPQGDIMLDTISAHELTHALQDQKFDLAKFYPTGDKIDEDAMAARRFVVEGDATFVMLLYALQSALDKQLTPPMLTMLRGQIESFANLDVTGMKAMAKSQMAAFGPLDTEIQGALDAMDSIPATVLVPLIDSYMKGALVAFTAYEQGGWPAVDRLYREPPTSTEQVLHPETKLFPVREQPRKVTLAKSADDELDNNVLGELQWRIYFDLWKLPNAAVAAAGWGGDRYSVARRKDGRLIGRIATVWDSETEAAEFAAAYVASVAARFPGATGTPEAGIARADGGKIFVKTIGARVYIADGADDAGALDALVKTSKLAP